MAAAILAIVLLTDLSLGPIAGAVGAEICKGNPRLVGDCFEIHGRFGVYNGNPTFRIWRVGTKRVFGVKDDEDPIVPENLARHIPLDGRVLFGDFVLCPLNTERDGRMQMVCVESARHLVLRHD